MNGTEQELVAEIKKYRSGVLGASEAKVRGNGMKMIGILRALIWACRQVERERVWQFWCQKDLVSFLRNGGM